MRKNVVLSVHNRVKMCSQKFHLCMLFISHLNTFARVSVRACAIPPAQAFSGETCAHVSPEKTWAGEWGRHVGR